MEKLGFEPRFSEANFQSLSPKSLYPQWTTIFANFCKKELQDPWKHALKESNSVSSYIQQKTNYLHDQERKKEFNIDFPLIG